MLILTGLSTIFVSYTVIRDPDKKSSIFGKILIFGGVLGLITLYVEQGQDIADLDALVRVFATVTGLYLERVSPHKNLKKFMFLAISTKVEFIIVTAFNALIINHGFELYLQANFWYALVALMGLSVPILALEKLNAYRIIVWITTLISIILLADLVISTSNLNLIIIGTVAVLWPAITARILGRKVFF